MDTDFVDYVYNTYIMHKNRNVRFVKTNFFKPKLYNDKSDEYVNNCIEIYNLISMVNEICLCI